MAIRQDKSISSNIPSIDNINDKTSLRKYILNIWINEKPNQKYRYFVENLNNGQERIYLERPGKLNKGCDFIIYIENHILYKNGNDKPPAHNFIINDLSDKKSKLSPKEWLSLLKAIESIYNCDPFDTSFIFCNNLPDIDEGESYELILKLLRWLFIEQDITYWSGKGRKMLYDEILKL